MLQRHPEIHPDDAHSRGQRGRACGLSLPRQTCALRCRRDGMPLRRTGSGHEFRAMGRLLRGDVHVRTRKERHRAREGRLSRHAPRLPADAGRGVFEIARVPHKPNDHVLQEIASNPNIKLVILAAAWAKSAVGTPYGVEDSGDVYLTDTAHPRNGSTAQDATVFAEGFERLIQKLTASGKHVAIIASLPETGWEVPETLARIALAHSAMDIRPPLRVCPCAPETGTRCLRRDEGALWRGGGLSPHGPLRVRALRG